MSDIKIILSQAASDYMEAVTMEVDAEVGGLGYCFETESGDLYVDEVFILPQEVSSAHVGFEGEAIAIAQEKAAIDGRLEDLRFSWHSHGSMGVFWSTTDEDAIERYLKAGTPWLLSMVVNRRGDRLGRFDVADVPVLGQVTLDKLDIKAKRANPCAAKAADDVKEMVKVYSSSYGRKWREDKTGIVSSGKPSTWPSEDSVHEGFAKISGLTGNRDIERDEDGEPIEIHGEVIGANEMFLLDHPGDPNGLTPREEQDLRDAGFVLEEMDQDQILDALIFLDLDRAGIA